MPELAVIDAYRAGIAANQMRKDEDDGLSRYQAAFKYLRAERLAVEGGEAWTSERRRFVQGGWAYSALSTLVINDIPELEDPKAAKCERFLLNKRQVVCMALEIRAIYRLCGALFTCGDGVRSDALGLIDDAHKRCTGMDDWEKTYFQMLGTEILNDCMKPWDESMDDPQSLAYLSLTEQRRRDEERRKTKDSMLAKTTKLRSSRYRWDIHEPELDDADWQKLLRSCVQQTTKNCSPHFIDTPDIWDEAFQPYVELRADRDIYAGELVLSERTRSNVTFRIPKDVSENICPPPSSRYYCDTCSCLMIVPRGCLITYQSTTTLPPNPPPSSHHSDSPTISRSSQDSATAPYGSDISDSITSPVISSPPHPSVLTHDTPSPHLPPTAKPDITFYAPTNPLPTCTPACLTARRSPFEHMLLTTHLHCKNNQLSSLLLLRLFATALAEDTHPLQNRDLLFANCGAACQSQKLAKDAKHRKEEKKEGKEWSFTNNVVRPIWIIENALQQAGTDQWRKLEMCDGWVLLTLMDKIESAMRISQGPGFAKVYSRGGMVEKTVYADDDEWQDLVDVGDEEERGGEGGEGDGVVWSASIHPVLNMVRVADEGRGEVPNVRFLRREGLVGVALGEDGEVAVRAGEALVRAGD